MFVFHVAFSLALLTLIGGCFLYMKASSYKKEAGAGFSKLIGLLIIIVSLFNVFCISYNSYKLWQLGFYDNMMTMHKDVANTKHHHSAE